MWATAILLGFAGSIHCVGMCSPLAMAVTSMRTDALRNRVIYNGGRILVYAIAGALVASVGMVVPFGKYQNFISVVAGLSLLVTGFTGVKNIRVPGMTWIVLQTTSFLKHIFAGSMKQKSNLSIFIMGAINGMLPCGLTFIALTACLALRGPVDGFTFMLLFGAGTLPVMLGFTSFLPLLARKLNLSLSKLTTSMLILSGIVLIARVFIMHSPHTTSTDSGLVELMLCK